MLKAEKKPFSALLTPDKIQRLIFGRLALIFLLLIVIWWWKNSYLQLETKDFPGDLFVLFAISIWLTVVYSIALKFNKNLILQVRAQFLTDVFLITWLIWVTGDLISPYISLYIILICVAAFYLGNVGTLLIAGLCALCFTSLPLLSSQSLIASFSGEVRPSSLLQIIGFNTVAILLVGLLAARFSERHRISEQLKETAENFADLHILHERIVESIRSGLITTDLHGKIYSFNRAAEEICGRKADETIGQSIFSIFGEDIRVPVELYLETVERSEFSTEHFETEITAADNRSAQSNITVACSIEPLIGKTGGVSGLILTFQDITQLRVMEETLRRSDRLAAVGRMAAGLAHEIRNPLGAMGASLQFFQEKFPPSTPEASLLDVVLRESERLNHIITNFLTYARPSADILTNNSFSNTDVGEAIRDCFALLSHSPEIKKNHLLQYDLPETPVRINANSTQLKQVFWNLLRNSIQAMPSGGKVNVSLKDYSDKNVEIVFEDTGGGISDEYLEHLFEPFSSHARGTGLGLSIVHKIVQDHGGRIDVQSRAGKGTKITVELPH